MKALFNAPGVVLSLIFAILTAVFVFIFEPDLLSNPRFISAVLANNLPVYMALAPVTVLLIISGGLDLSLGAMVGLSAMIFAVAQPALGDMGAALAALAVGLVIGIFNGLLAGGTRIPGMLVTLAMGALLQGSAFLIAGDQISRMIQKPNLLSTPAFPWLVLAVSLLLGLLLGLFTLSRPAVRHKDAEESWGKRLLYTGLPYVLSSLTAALVGLNYVGRLGAAFVSPMSWLEVKMALIALLGGVPLFMPYMSFNPLNILGGLFAALAWVFFATALLQVGGNINVYQVLVCGILLLFAAFTSYIYYTLISRARPKQKPEPLPEQPSIEASPVV
jgi:ribose transport system permease protein